MDIQLFRPRYEIDECLAEIRECLAAGWTGAGYKTVQFEEAWKGYTHLPHALFVNSATAGLHLAVAALMERLGWQRGDEVISTPLTFVSTNHAILYQGLQVRFADIDDSLCLDPDSVASRITSRTRAVVYVGLGGNTGQFERIVQLCKEHGLSLILDAAHMAGTRLHGEHIGKGADATVFSFQAVKNLPTADSGMVCFANHADDALARKLSWMGISKDTYTRTHNELSYKWMYDVEHLGYKYHGNSIMAAMGLVQLRYLDRDNAYRRQIARWYDELLAGHDLITSVDITDGCESSYHLYPVLVDNRDPVLLALNNVGVAPGVHYRDNTLYAMYAHGDGTCPRARRASERLISLPLHLGLSRDDVTYVSERLVDIVNRTRQYA